ncbi:MAG: hypothetical protein ACRDNS_14055 [Trebonia sp.]
MLTLTETQAELTPAALRFTALFGMSLDVTATELRNRLGGTAQKAKDKQLADEIDLMTACGYTGRVATTVLAERDRANEAPHLRYSCPEQAGREIRAVAGAAVDQEGPAAVRILRGIAAASASEGDSQSDKSFTEFADAAEQLLAERGAEPLT